MLLLSAFILLKDTSPSPNKSLYSETTSDSIQIFILSEIYDGEFTVLLPIQPI